MSYGRNFAFRTFPDGADRAGRWYLNGTAGATVPIGAPIVLDSSASDNSLGLKGCKLATGAQAPKQGLAGILVYEYGPAGFAGDDPWLTTYADKDAVEVGKAVQMVSGTDVKVVFTNTSATTFLNTRDYAGRIMVAGAGIATPTVAVGDMLTPGTGNDTDGYWAETATASQAWLIVTKVDNVRKEVEARFTF